MEVVSYFLPDLPISSTRDNEESPHDRPYSLFVGRLESIKGLDEVIDVCRSYKGADLLVAGDGEDGPRLRALASGIENIVFLGRIPHDRLDALYRNAIALIVPSVGYETFGIILIESFRNGTPVLARRIGPFPEIVERCGGGILFDGPADLTVAMRSLQDDPDKRRLLADRALSGFSEYWSESAVVPRYLDVVRRAAVSSGRTHILDRIGGNLSE
jgi:glycosyltransferase involved in cell wall biosynthesis